MIKIAYHQILRGILGQVEGTISSSVYQRYLMEIEASTVTLSIVELSPYGNELPKLVVDAVSINAFKNRLDEHWMNHPLKYNHKHTS